MKKISFYRANDIYKVACTLTEKAYYSGAKIMVATEDEEMQEHLNRILWTYSKAQFIPHGSNKDPLPEKQIVYISSSFENLNNSTIIILMLNSNIEKFLNNKNFIYSFDRIMLIYSNSELNEKLALLDDNKIAEHYKQDAKNIWIKEK
jgi:DNA polymerase-3 subunit chi